MSTDGRLARLRRIVHKMDYRPSREDLVIALNEIDRLERENESLRKIIQQQNQERERIVADALHNDQQRGVRIDELRKFAREVFLEGCGGHADRVARLHDTACALGIMRGG